ncbi:MAG: response regulator transcription factor [Chloroflexi bacterium]|nr:response regulator transcription factor [Chloroflexota bacterium]
MPKADELDESWLKVLLVEDSALVRERLVEAIQEIESVQVIGQVADAPAAIAAAERLAPDVIVLDLHLASGNGFAVLERVKACPTPPAVIVLTGFPLAPYREKCIALGADFFFDKASEFDGVAPAIRQLAKGKAKKPPRFKADSPAGNNQPPLAAS